MLTGNGDRQLEGQWLSDDRSIAGKAAMTIHDDDEFESPRFSLLVAVAVFCLLVVALVRAVLEDCVRR
jgi:hypothetical protein